jgi:hypothetical protein
MFGATRSLKVWQGALLAIAALAVAGSAVAVAVDGKQSALPQGKTVQGVGGKKYVTKSVPAQDGAQVVAKCPRGTHVSGGGAGADNGGGDVNESTPYDSGDDGSAPDDGWAAYFNDTGNVANMRVYAICE